MTDLPSAICHPPSAIRQRLPRPIPKFQDRPPSGLGRSGGGTLLLESAGAVGHESLVKPRLWQGGCALTAFYYGRYDSYNHGHCKETVANPDTRTSLQPLPDGSSWLYQLDAFSGVAVDRNDNLYYVFTKTQQTTSSDI